MIRISSFLHRERLYRIIRRWMSADLRPDDARELLQLVHFNNVYVSRYLGRFADELFTALYPGALHVEKVTNKGALRDLVSRDPMPHCSRCVELIAAYRRDPGRYFRETPFNGSLYFHGTRGPGRYVGSSRIKRIRRLAEKTARRLVDGLHAETRQAATGGGLPRDATPDAAPGAENGLPDGLQLPDSLAINDVAGIKLILEAHELERLLALLQAAGCRLIEQERHDGMYRATNLVVGYRPDAQRILEAPLHDRMIRVFAAHGFDARQANADFREFVLTGEETIRLEIIVTSYLEMLESEIGRCIHEERIIRQRHNPRYYGQLAQNIGFLMEFLFTFPAVPGARLEHLPVRIRDRYLPDYFDEVRRKLFNNPSVELNEL